jgi:integrase
MMEAVLSKKTGLPRYVARDWHKSGNEKLVFRRNGKKVTLPSPALSDAFWLAYVAALAGKKSPGRIEVRKAREGTFRALCEAYYRSAAFKARDTLTQSDRRGVLESCLAEPLEPGSELAFGDCPASRLSRKHIVVLRDRKAKWPWAANKRLLYLRQMFVWAIEAELMLENPAREVSRIAVRRKGYHTWTPEELEQFERHHAPGSKARLALALMGFAGLRRSDACTVGQQHLQARQDGLWLQKVQHKNRARQGKVIEIPVLPSLEEAIKAVPRTGLALLETEYGRPYSIKAFGLRFKKWCVEAGLPHCSSHGVRKAAACLAAMRGATDSQLQSIFGWEDTREIRTYTEKMNRAKIAGDAIWLLSPGETGNKIVPRNQDGQKRGTKP